MLVSLRNWPTDHCRISAGHRSLKRSSWRIARILASYGRPGEHRAVITANSKYKLRTSCGEIRYVHRVVAVILRTSNFKAARALCCKVGSLCNISTTALRPHIRVQRAFQASAFRTKDLAHEIDMLVRLRLRCCTCAYVATHGSLMERAIVSLW